MRKLSEFPDAHLRIFDRPPVPDRVRDVYLIGICGTGMGSLAGLLKEAGYRVRGSDSGIYPPMSTHLAKLDIDFLSGYDASHLDYGPDLVIVGNACPPTHVEAAAARDRSLPQLSFPEALAHFFLRHRRSVVVAGTHGKTTTTGLLIHLMRARDPSYLVGGIISGRSASYGLGSGPHFVVEGDEYDSAYFDKRPKFLHYKPHAGLVTSMELDHADIYRSFAEYQEAFAAFAHLVRSTLVLCDDQPVVSRLADATGASVLTYGLRPTSHVSASDIQIQPDGQQFTLTIGCKPTAELHLPLFGRHNLLNALGACSLALAEGLPSEALSFSGYRGIKRRLQVLGEVRSIAVVDDFAHHPTAVCATIQAARDRWPTRRLLAVFEPRTNSSRRKIFEALYSHAFDAAALAFISAPPFRHNDDPARFMDTAALAREICQRGTPTRVFSECDALLPALLASLQENDVVLIMSNGSFGGLHSRLLSALRNGE